MADKLQADIDRKRNTSLKDKPPTRRRLNMIDSMARDAQKLEQLQDKLRALAAGLAEGSLPDELRGLTAKNQVEYVLFRPEAPRLDYEEAAYKRMQRAGLIGSKAYSKARMALLAMGDPEAGQDRPADQIAKLEMEARLWKIPGYFPTPAPVVERLLHLANILPGETVLEPSAGNGNIADAIRASHPDAELHVCEIAPGLREILTLKDHTVIGWDCLALSGETYDTIVMNPPFEHLQDVEHVTHAFDLLKPGGRIVAIMGEVRSSARSARRRTSASGWTPTAGPSPSWRRGPSRAAAPAW
jgi:hypothetical protein